jgi:protein TonB
LTRFRFPIAFVLASCLTVGLFWGLRVLIGVEVELTQLFKPPRIEFTRLTRDTDVEEKKRVKPVIEKPDQQPVAPTVTTAKSSSVDPGTDLASLAPGVDYSGSGGGMGGFGGGAAALAVGSGVDRECVPQVRIQPEYPMRAQQQGVEGWAVVEFTVARDGSVKNARILQAQPSSIFDRAAVQAVSSWKYSPKIQDGKPVECPTQRVRLAFTLEK